jgi:glucose/arabinose dehydrogenase
MRALAPMKVGRPMLVALVAVVLGGTLLEPIADRPVAAAQPGSTPCPIAFLHAGAQPGEADCQPASPQVAVAGTVPAGFRESVVWSGLVNPTALRFAADGRVFVAEKGGRIKIFDNLADQTPTIFSDLVPEVFDYWDRGLLGIALDPSLAGGSPTGYLYVLYTYDHVLGSPDPAPRWGDTCPSPPGATTDGCVASGRLARFAVSGSTIAPGEQVLLEDWCQQFPSHSVGTVFFGPDGALYVSAGEGSNFNQADWGQFGGTTTPVVTPMNPCNDSPGGAMAPPSAEGGALRAQDMRTTGDPTTLDGAILRLNPTTGAGMPGNPFAGSSDANARRIIAYGLRNPFRITPRPGTNELWVGEVGWSQWEEINLIPSMVDNVAENFGWPCYQNLSISPSYHAAGLDMCENLYAAGSSAVAAPYYAYQHSAKVVSTDACPTGSSSVTGLAFYPESGGVFPASFDGALFFADYSRNCIWYIPKGSNGQPDTSARQPFVEGAASPVDLVVGPNGDLFYVDLVGGTIRRVSWIAGNQPPTASFTATPSSGATPLDVTFDASGSADPEGLPLTYAWDLDGNGLYNDATGVSTTHTYNAAGNVHVGLEVTDVDSASDTTTRLISPGNDPPVPTISSPSASLTWQVGDQISFSGSATDAQDGALPPADLSWNLTILHCPSTCHTHDIQSWPGFASGSFAAPDHEYPSHLLLTLTATDSWGISASTSVELDPETVTLSLRSSPPGLQLVFNENQAATPFDTTVIIGSSNVLTAPLLQTLSGHGYKFQGWSNGGSRSQAVIAPAAPTTYTATYVPSSFTITPIADAFVRKTSPGTNYGKTTNLRAFFGTERSYLKFNVSGLTGPAADVRLRLWVTDPSSTGITVYRAGSSWTETGITWRNKPGLIARRATASHATLRTWLELDLGKVIGGNGTYTFAIQGNAATTTRFASRETGLDPQLIVFR